MSTSAETAQRKFEEVAELVAKFTSQSQQIRAAEEDIRQTQKLFKEKTDTLIKNIYQFLKTANSWLTECSEEVQDMTYSFTESYGPLKEYLLDQNFTALCQKLSELANIWDECKEFKNQLLSFEESIVEEVSKRVINEITQKNEEMVSAISERIESTFLASQSQLISQIGQEFSLRLLESQQESVSTPEQNPPLETVEPVIDIAPISPTISETAPPKNDN